MSLGDIHNHNGSICTASKRPCPFGDEGHSKDIDSYVEHHAQVSGIDGAQVKAMIADGTPPADAVEVAKSGAQASPKLQKTVEELKMTPEGVARFQEYKQKWSKYWEKFSSSGTTTERDDAVRARSNPGTYDGAWVPSREDGSMEIPAGDYVLLQEGIFVKEEAEEAVEAWSHQALVTTPPGTVGGAYLNGKPAYFLTSESMGDNHGYDGEVLMPKETHDDLVAKGAFEEWATPGINVNITKDTVLYGQLGNPKSAPEKAYDWSSENRNNYWDEDTMDEDTSPLGSIFNHPLITVEGNDEE